MSNIVGALLYLRVTSIRNALLGRLRRLKQPKYLAGGVIGVVYLYFAFFRRVLANRGTNATMAEAIRADLLPIAAAVCALLLLIAFMLCWVWPRERASLRFTEAEIAFLFPAPVRRRTLVHFQLISAQGRIFFTALIASLFSSGWSFLGGSAPIRVVGWWIIVATLSLHIMGSSFVITKLLDRGITPLRRQLLAIGAFALVVIVGVAWVWHEVEAPSAEDLSGFSAFARYLAPILNSGPLSWILLLPKFVIRPLLATDLRSFLTALGPALVVYAIHYLWIVNTEVSIEEASIARAEKRAARLVSRRQGKYRLGKAPAKGRRPPFELHAVKRPELAFLWKNLLSSASYLRPRTAVIAAIAIAGACTWFSGNLYYEAMRPALAIFAAMIGAYLVVLGPQLARQDLRNDLANTDILKTYPLHGWQVVLGEILTPLAIVTVLVWLALLTGTLAFRQDNWIWLTPQLRAGVALSVALVIPLLCALQLLVLNAAVVLFPAWIQTTRQASGGIDVMGQRLLFLAGNVFVVLIALLPATLAAAALFYSARWIVGDVPAAAAGVLVVLTILSVEAWLGIQWLGKRFERFDLSAELRP